MDNMSEKLQGNLFCEATEQPEIMLRKFGALEGIYIEQCFTFLATGVNITATKTMERRVLLSELDARHPRAYRKKFKKSPYRIIAETRGQFITDILTIYQCWVAAGSPKVARDFASYGQYSDLIRSMLVWLGEADPVDSTDKLFNTDPERVQISEIFHACRMVLETMKPAYKLAELANDQHDARDQQGHHGSMPLYDALAPVAKNPHDWQINTQRLGNWLRDHVGKEVEYQSTDVRMGKWSK